MASTPEVGWKRRINSKASVARMNRRVARMRVRLGDIRGSHLSPRISLRSCGVLALRRQFGQRGCEVPERIHLLLGFDENEIRFSGIARHDPVLAEQLFEECGDRLIMLLGLPGGIGLDTVA